MAGEINGTKVLITRGSDVIVGQMEATVTFNGTPIDISNKSTQDWVALLDGELAGKQLVVTGTIIYNDDTVYRAVRDDVFSGTQSTYTIEYTSSASTNEEFSAAFTPNGLSDSIPMGDKVTTSITLSSSGAVTRTAAVT